MPYLGKFRAFQGVVIACRDKRLPAKSKYNLGRDARPLQLYDDVMNYFLEFQMLRSAGGRGGLLHKRHGSRPAHQNKSGEITI